MEPKVYLSNIASFVGETFELSLYPDLVGKPELQKTLYDEGFKYYSATDKSHAEMSMECIHKVMKSAGLEPTDLDLIIYSSSTVEATDDDEFEQYLVDNGFPNVYTAGMRGAACGSLVQTFEFAMKYLRSSDDFRNAIVISTNKCPSDWVRNAYESTLLLSDGATACLLSKDTPGLEFVDSEYKFDRRIKQLSHEGTAEGNFQSMKLAAKQADKILERMFSGANMNISNVDQVITNSSGYSWQSIGSTILDCDISKMSMDTLEDLAHIFSGEQLISLERYLSRSEKPKEENGYIILFFMSDNGVGATMLRRRN